MKKLLRNLSVLCLVIAAALATGCYHEELPFLNVDHEVVLVGPQTDKGTVVIESNVDWEATSDVEWITLDNGFGNHKGTFEFFVEANTTPNERSGKIKIEGNGCSKTILVRQQSEGSKVTLATDNISFTKYAGEYLMSIACNGDWKVTSSADWCKVEPTSGKGNGSFKVTVEENNTGADRVAKISVLSDADGVTQVRTVEVFQSASNAALVVSPESKQLTAEASNFELDVITVGSWSASLDSDWLTLDESEGEGDAQITVSATKNDTGKERVAIITFATGAENENRVIRQIVVRQAAVDFYLVVPVTDYPLSLDEQSIEIPYVLEGSNVTVAVKTNSKWMTVASVADGVATVNVAENTTALAREGVITFTTQGQAGDPIVRFVRVAQAPTINLLEVLADEYAVEWTGETFRIPIYSNTPVAVRSTESWCTVVADGQDVVITVPQNDTSYPRTAVVTVTTDSEKGETLSRTTVIRQAAAYSELVVTPESKNIYAIEQSFVASIVTNNSWTASSDSSWLTIDETEGVGDYMLTVTAAENKTGQVRTATITIQTGAENSKRESATITVTQRPEQFYFEVPTTSYLVDKNRIDIKVPYLTAGNEQSVKASSNVDWLVVQEVEDGFATVAVLENTTAEVRTGVVTITCTPVFGDPVAVPVSFTQSPTINILDVFVDVIDVMARGDEVSLPYYSNTEISVSSSEAWCHAEATTDPEDIVVDPCCNYVNRSQMIIKIEVDPNRTGEARVAYVTLSTVNYAGEKITKVITIRQAALYAALSITPKNVVLPAHEGHFRLTINTTGTWASTTSCTWLETEDETEGFGDATLFIEAGVNDTGMVREGDIIVATGPENNEREEQVVHVIQLTRDTYIEVPIAAYAVGKENQELSVGYFAAGDFKDMQVNCSEDWIQYDGGDDVSLIFNIDENTTAEPRTAIVTVTLDLVAGEPLTDTFIVTQAPTINILDVYVDSYEASPWGEEIVFPFYGNTEVGVSVSAKQSGWCNVLYGTPNQDTDPHEIVIGVSKNESAEARVAYVTLTTVTDKGEKLTHIITIHQNPLNAALVVNPEKVILPAHNADFYMTVVTTGTWKLDFDCYWLDPEDWSGEGDYDVYFEANDNETGMQREATVIVWTGEENETRVEKRVQVIQLAADTYLDIPQDSFVVSKEQQSFHAAMFAAGDITNADWDCSALWLEVSELDVDNNLLGLKVSENTTGEPRTATVTITIERAGGEPYTDSFTVTQAGTYNVLEGLSDRVVAEAAGAHFELPVITNVDDLNYVISEQDWIGMNPIDVTDGYAVVAFDVDANTTGKERHASITLITATNKGERLEKKIMVYQPAADQNFAILTGENMYMTKAESSVDIAAYASVNADQITMKSNSPWLAADPAELTVSGDIATGTFKAAVNNTGAPRTATVTVTFFDETGATVQKLVNIYQSATDGGDLEALVDFITVAAAGEDVVLTFETEDPLTAVASSPWISNVVFDATVDPQQLTITVDENTTGLDRTGYITVSNGSESKVITVFQPAKDTHFAVLSPDVIYITPKKQDVDILAYASVNADQVTATSSASWLTAKDPVATVNATNVTLGFEAKKNNDTQARTASVKISFVEENGAVVNKTVQVIQAAQDGVFNIPDDVIVLAAAGEFKDVAFLSSEAITVTSSSEWLGHEELPAGDPTYIRVKAGANTTGVDRAGFIQVTNGKQLVTIDVFQPAATTDFALLSPDYIFIGNAGGDIDFTTYAANVPDQVTAVPSASWLSWKGNDGMFGNIKVHHFAAAANTGEERTIEVKFTYVDQKGVSHQEKLTVIQEGAVEQPNVFEVPIDNLVMATEGEFKDIAFLSTDAVTVTSSSAWLNHEELPAGDPTYIRITASANNTGADRTGFVQVTNGKQMITINVFQPAAESQFAVLTSDIIQLGSGAETIKVTAYGSTVDEISDITMFASASWLEAKSKTVDGHKVTRPFAVEANTTGESRSAVIKVTYTDDKGATYQADVIVVQAAAATDEAILEALVDAIELSPAGDSQTIAFVASDDIKASSSAGWLTAAVPSTSKDRVLLKADANTTGRDRTAYVTVQLASDPSKKALLTVFQPTAASEFTLLTPSKAISAAKQDVILRAYCSDKVEDGTLNLASDASWVKLSKENPVDPNIARIKVAAEENTTNEVREAVVIITWRDANNKLFQEQATIVQSPTENILDIYVTSLMVPYMATEEYLPIYDNATNVVAKSSNSARVQPSIVTNTDTETKDVKLVIAENTTSETLITYVTVSAKFNNDITEEKVISVIQTPKDAEVPAGYVLEFAMESVTLAAAGETKEIDVNTTATDYTVASSAAWLTATKGSVIVEAEPNTSTEPREATVTVTAQFEDGTVLEKTITVTQEGVAASAYAFEPQAVFETDKTAKTVNIPFTATENPLTVGSIAFTVLPAWIEDTMDPEHLELNIQENTTGSEREATITIRYEAPDNTIITKDVLIKQSASADETLTVDMASEVAASSAAGSYSVVYRANLPVTVDVTPSSDDTWITNPGFTPEADNKSGVVGFDVAENTNADSRTGHIVVAFTYGTQTVTKEIAVQQSAPAPTSTYTFEPQAEVVTDKDGKIIHIQFTSTESPLATGSIAFTSLPAWIQDGANPELLEIEIEENETGSEREGTVTIQYTAPDNTVITKNVTVRQSAGYF